MLRLTSILRALAGWAGRHKLPVTVFGSLLGVILAVLIEERDHKEILGHVLDREFSVHLGWGALLYMLLTRLAWAAELRSGRYLDWYAWYLLPIGAIGAINAANEWLLSFTQIWPWDWVNPLGGDWMRAVRAGDLPLRWKSVADMAGWQIGALACAWYTYFMPRRLWRARIGYLRHRGDVSASATATASDGTGTGAAPVEF